MNWRDDMSTTPTIPAPTPTVQVPIKSAWASKINWGQAIGMVASVLVIVTGGKVNIDASTQAALLGGIQAVVAVYTVVMKTFFTSTVTPSSAPTA